MLAFLKRYRELLLVAALLLFPAGTYIANAKQGRELSTLDRFFLAASAPIGSVVDGVVGGAIDLVHDYVALRGVREENERLHREVFALRDALHASREQELENGRLRQLLAFAEAEKGGVVAAPVVGVSPTHRRTITIAKGGGDGIAPGMAVVTGEGVVGKVVATFGGYAEVQLLVDPSFAMAARVQRSRFRATVRGTGDEAVLRLDNALRTGDVEDGDLLVSSGTDRVFPKGLVIGRVQQVERKPHGMYLSAEVKPAVDVAGREEVLVLGVPGEGAQPNAAAEPAAVAPALPGAP